MTEAFQRLAQALSACFMTHSITTTATRKGDALHRVERALACHTAQHTRILASARKVRAEARAAATGGDRERAKQCLKRCKGMQLKAVKVEHLIDMCQQVMDSYADGEMVRDTVGALTDAQMIFNPSEANRLYDQLGKATDDIVDARDVMEDVNQVLREGSERVASVDADDLEEELEALMRGDAPDDDAAKTESERASAQLANMPTVPPSVPARMQRHAEPTRGGLRSAYATLGVLPETEKKAMHAD